MPLYCASPSQFWTTTMAGIGSVAWSMTNDSPSGVTANRGCMNPARGEVELEEAPRHSDAKGRTRRQVSPPSRRDRGRSRGVPPADPTPAPPAPPEATSHGPIHFRVRPHQQLPFLRVGDEAAVRREREIGGHRPRPPQHDLARSLLPGTPSSRARRSGRWVAVEERLPVRRKDDRQGHPRTEVAGRGTPVGSMSSQCRGTSPVLHQLVPRRCPGRHPMIGSLEEGEPRGLSSVHLVDPEVGGSRPTAKP